ncbi:MAG: NADH-quinone oxidoreductase subunit L [Acidobacteriota bacterium]
MAWIVRNLWLIPALPLLAGGIIALAKRSQRVLAASLAIGSMAVSFVLALIAFAHVLSLGYGEHAKEVANINWFQMGQVWVQVGWVLDPLTAVMLVMVTFVGSLIFIYSIGYMHDDENFTRFFCFLALFAAAMLGVVISNSLLLLFMCWEIMGLTSYLLIGFWFHKPSAAAAAKKAFIVTRIGDLGLFIGMAWLYAQTGTLLFFDAGKGCVEPSALSALVSHTTIFGWTLSTAIGLLIFCGAAGKSGQVPLHVWLPDAMEGPTPVSALIHAATMVAAGVFLIARVYPLMAAQVPSVLTPTLALQVVTWVGAITAVFASLIAVAQWDIKRILAYSTVAQLGYMMMGLGVGGVSIGMFHLITHAFFKALLFLGAGSVIHGCSGEQDIRHMGGLKKSMRVTWLVYTAGTLALCGVVPFAGFWSKDEILHSAFAFSLTRVPFYLGAFGALLTAFYMTRQYIYVFFGTTNRPAVHQDFKHEEPAAIEHGHHSPHESPAVMTVPLVVLSVFAVLLGFMGAPFWPWFQSFIEGAPVAFSAAPFMEALPLMAVSSMIVLVGIGLGWALYGRRPITSATAPDVLEAAQPQVFGVLNHAFYVDAFYKATFVRLNDWAAAISDWFDRWVWSGVVQVVSYSTLGFAWFDNFVDTNVVNGGFDEGCETVSRGGKLLSLLQNGRAQSYLRMIGLALIVLVVILLWEARA